MLYLMYNQYQPKSLIKISKGKHTNTQLPYCLEIDRTCLDKHQTAMGPTDINYNRWNTNTEKEKQDIVCHWKDENYKPRCICPVGYTNGNTKCIPNNLICGNGACKMYYDPYLDPNSKKEVDNEVGTTFYNPPRCPDLGHDHVGVGGQFNWRSIVLGPLDATKRYCNLQINGKDVPKAKPTD
jgi:hypothetical protein